jgi:long-chain acyl-CoA synthetase
MAESLAQFFLDNFSAHRAERAYGQHRGYRMEWFTYGQVLETAFSFSRELQTRQIVKGDRVMLWGENSTEWVTAFIGCALLGVVIVPMDNAASPDFAVRVSRQVAAKLWVCSRKHSAESPAENNSAPHLALEDLSQALGHHAAAAVPYADLTRADMLQIVFTSGTTAEPKGVAITHGNVLANIDPLDSQIKPYLKYERWVHPIRFLNLLPLSHVFGQFLGMFLPPLLGGIVIFQEELKPSEIVDTIRRERVSVLVTVPRVLQSLKQKIERDVEDRGKLDDFRRRFRDATGKHFLQRWWVFRSIRRQFGWKFWAFICGGAALDSETEEFWDRLGYAAIQGYGLTETTSLISVNHPFKLGKGSIGKVLPGREVKLADDGEIMIRGAGVASGYWNANRSAADQSATSQPTANPFQQVADEQGWYRTGDIGALDASGNLYFKGRKKDVIVTPAGLNIYPEDLESALRSQPEVKDCVVVGIDRGGNAEPCAVLILKNHSPAHADEIVQRANKNLADFQRMRMWIEWPQEDFPRTSTQKPRRNLIADFAARQLLHPGAAQNATAERHSAESPIPEDPIKDLIARISGRSAAGANAGTQLDSDLGLSSLDRVELIGALEDRYQVDLSDAGFSSVRTVGDVQKMLRVESLPRVEFHYPAWVLRWPITWLRWFAYYFLMRPAMFLLAWPRIEGRENLRNFTGPMLVVSNHIGDLDIGFIQTALPARLRDHLATATRGEALEALHSPAPVTNIFRKVSDRLAWTLGVSLLNLFSLPREAGFRKSFAYAGMAVDRGYSVLVFPEGRHTVDGKINPFRSGIGLLANNLNIPVLPMRIIGLFELKQSGRRFARPHEIEVRIGRPMPPSISRNQRAERNRARWHTTHGDLQ